MRKIIVFFLLVTGNFLSSAQTHQVFKGDTINRKDKNNLPQGLWKKYYPPPADALFSEGVYKNGKHTGTFHTYYKSGKLQSVMNYRGVTEVCSATIYFEDGKIKAKGKYIDKNKDSLWTYYSDLGTVISTEYYLKGKKEGSWKTFYPKGSLSEETTYKNDLKNGPFKEFFENGKRKLEAYMVNGSYEGATIVFHPNGNVWMKGNYLNGLRNGSWHIFKEDGQPDHDEEYKDGINLNPGPPELEQKLEEPKK